MKIELIGEPKLIMGGVRGLHAYFGWPTSARLKDGTIAVGASGYRLTHICPFGKGVMCRSIDNGESFYPVETIIQTTLDDRDVGLCPFGKSGLIVTSFTNSIAMQRNNAEHAPHLLNAMSFKGNDKLSSGEFFKQYVNTYLDAVTPEEEARDLGVTFRVSFDNGKTFGEIMKSPVSSPHGPLELKDGTILWVGREFSDGGEHRNISAYTLNPENGEMSYVGSIPFPEDIEGEYIVSEPCCIELKDGSLLCHIRIDQSENGKSTTNTLLQSKSVDGGKTWSMPEKFLSRLEGAPAHLFRLPDGGILCAYSHRQIPYSISAIVSYDEGESWSEPFAISKIYPTWDLGYPTTVALDGNTFLTFYYAQTAAGSPSEIFMQKWRYEK